MTNAPISDYQIGYFLERLSADEAVSVIRDVELAIKEERGDDYLCFDSCEDVDLRIAFPYFWVDNFRFTFPEIKATMYRLLDSIHPNYKQFIDEIEITNHDSIRQSMILKFSVSTNDSGVKNYKCDSLFNSDRGMCFVQFLSIDRCLNILDEIEKSQNSNRTEYLIYVNEPQNISIKYHEKWIRIGTPLDHAGKYNIGLGIQPRSAITFINEWIEFLRANC